MTTHLLHDWEEDVDLFVVGISSHLEDYRLAYAINKALGTALVNEAAPFSVFSKKEEQQYSLYFSPKNYSLPHFYLVSNQSLPKNNLKNMPTLFSDEGLYRSYLLNRFKKWPYILISEDGAWFDQLNVLRENREISYLHPIIYTTLNKNEQALIKEITYDE